MILIIQPMRINVSCCFVDFISWLLYSSVSVERVNNNNGNMRQTFIATCESPPPVSPAPSSTILSQTDKQIVSC